MRTSRRDCFAGERCGEVRRRLFGSIEVAAIMLMSAFGGFKGFGEVGLFGLEFLEGFAGSVFAFLGLSEFLREALLFFFQLLGALAAGVGLGEIGFDLGLNGGGEGAGGFRLATGVAQLGIEAVAELRAEVTVSCCSETAFSLVSIRSRRSSLWVLDSAKSNVSC